MAKRGLRATLWCLSLKFNPRNNSFQTFVSLLNFFSLFPSESSSGLRNDTLLSSRFIQKPVLQQWFLVQYRYCQKCGKSHFRDNWVRSPTRPTGNVPNQVFINQSKKIQGNCKQVKWSTPPPKPNTYHHTEACVVPDSGAEGYTGVCGLRSLIPCVP